LPLSVGPSTTSINVDTAGHLDQSCIAPASRHITHRSTGPFRRECSISRRRSAAIGIKPAAIELASSGTTVLIVWGSAIDDRTGGNEEQPSPQGRGWLAQQDVSGARINGDRHSFYNKRVFSQSSGHLAILDGSGGRVRLLPAPLPTKLAGVLLR